MNFRVTLFFTQTARLATTKYHYNDDDDDYYYYYYYCSTVNVLSGELALHDGLLNDFVPSPTLPGLQYIEHVDAGSAADDAGLLAGDFILEVNTHTSCCSFCIM